MAGKQGGMSKNTQIILIAAAILFALVAVGMLAMAGGGASDDGAQSNQAIEASAENTDEADGGADGEVEGTGNEQQAANEAGTSNSSNYKAHTWSMSKYPLYYKVWGKANTSDKVAEGKTVEGGLDNLGRTEAVKAKVTYEMVDESAGWREEMTEECNEISGWGHNREVRVELSNGRDYNGYAWNRSHLLADCLGGHAERKNLVTGTRTQNVGNNVESQPGGMQYTETLALNYLKSHHNGWVYYKATPVYKGDELVCRSVYVDIKSDDGSINQHVEVFNAMNGCDIDYDTGKVSGEAVQAAK